MKVNKCLSFQLGYEAGVHYQYSLIFLAALWSIVIIDSFFLFPQKHVYDTQEVEDKGKLQIQSLST